MATTTTHNKYGVPITSQVSRAVSSKVKQRIGSNYPLTYLIPEPNAVTGVLQARSTQAPYFNKATGLSLIKNNLRQLLLTEKGERIMLPDYGLSLKKYLFEPLDEMTFFLLKTDILKTLNKYFSIAHVISLSVFSNEKQAENHEILISLTLQLMDESLEMFDVEVTLG